MTRPNLLRNRNKLRFSRQLETLDCAPACLKMVSEYYGQTVSLDKLRELCKTSRLGTSVYSLITGADRIGLDSVATTMNINNLNPELPLPAILFWNKSHFVVLSKIISVRSKNIFRSGKPAKKYSIADPGFGVLRLHEDDFKRKWADDSGEGMIIFFEPKEEFGKSAKALGLENESSKKYFRHLLKLILKYKAGLAMILAGMLTSSAISLAFPIITQRIVDIGIKFSSRQFIMLALIFQVGLFLAMTMIDALKSWMVLYLGSKIEINLTYDFLTKVMKLPLYFFDAKLAGDLMQRIGDNGRIQNFIKTQFLDLIIAVASLVTLTFMIFHYSEKIFAVYFISSSAGIVWALYFIRKREILDYRRFDVNTENMDNLIETIVAMPEIKLNNAEEIKKKKWKEIQFKMFDVNRRLLYLQQYQNSGTSAINYLKNILVTFLSAQQVISGSMTIGEMIGLSFIVGQLNVPLIQLVSFFQFAQEANISFKRLAEIQAKKDEDDHLGGTTMGASQLIRNFDNIHVRKISFSYFDTMDDLIFNGLSVTIPRGKTTAIVGMSGSGKTTLLKLILKFYEPLTGSIAVGDSDLAQLPSEVWRKHCGVVMQEGFIFTDTIEHNICVSSEQTDRLRLREACRISCIDDFVSSLPMGYATKIGAGGMGLSTGQKQRILIARAVYKDPEIIFFDEATSALDANNERQIHKNLEMFLKGKTVMIIAHRLSTVRNADKIIVLDAGKIVEQGPHDHLVDLRGAYYELIKNQLELGS